MAGYIGRRILATIPVMGIAALIIFALMRLVPGDPAAIIAGELASPEQLQQIREHMGLQEPIHVQFVIWVVQLMRGDLGLSLISGVPVVALIADRAGPSLALGTAAILFSMVVAIPLGVMAAWKQGTLIDRTVMGFSVLGFSVPVFVNGYAAILFFAMILGWLPVQGYQPISAGSWPFLKHLLCRRWCSAWVT
jgi:peptide/nickel transport system permease protein